MEQPPPAPPKYRDERTERFSKGERIKEFQAFKDRAERRLDILDTAAGRSRLIRLPGNRFEALSSDQQGQFRIWINQQWRVCFEWPDDHEKPFHIEIPDYH